MARRFTRAVEATRRIMSGPAVPPDRGAAEADADRLAMLKWHIERYDRLRTSTASRAAVVLSAGAILSAGNALLLGQLLGKATGWLNSWWLLGITVPTLVTAVLVVMSLMRAANVLLTTRGSRKAFGALGDVPVSLIFNGADTVARLRTFDEFRGAVAAQATGDMVAAAEVELWVCIHQHRHRYTQLRAAVRLLRYAAPAFLVILAVVMVANLVYAF